MPKRREVEPVRIGVAWFERELWQRLTEVVPDRKELDDTFQQWERTAKKAIEELERCGSRSKRYPSESMSYWLGAHYGECRTKHQESRRSSSALNVEYD